MSKHQKPKSETPVRYDAYQVQAPASEGGKSFWTRIGVAFPHSDGKGYNVVLQAFPVDGKLVVRLHEPKEGDDESA